ncbi:hypothetical protein [Actinomadura nitritigenes]|uniref:hypothetical protein n=1 Tax=Actinomadura nitritigenes TaxID=134602 RepID=UPI003D8DEDA6
MPTTPVAIDGDVARCAYHAGDACKTSTASAVETAGICRCVRVRCAAASDGFHEHIWTLGFGGVLSKAIVRQGLHVWMDEWRADHPGRSDFTLELPGGRIRDVESAEAAFAELGVPEYPNPTCTISTNEESA